MNQDFNNYNEGQNHSSNMYQQPVNSNNFKTNTYVAPEPQQQNNNQHEKKNNNLILILIVLIGLILMSVGIYFVLNPKEKDMSNNNNPNNSENNQNGEIVNPPQQDDNTNKEEESKLLTGTYKVPLKQVYVDVPNYTMIEEGYTRLFWNKGISYITFTYLQPYTANSLLEAHNIVFKDFKMAVDSHHHLNEQEDLKMEEITVNSIQTLKYEGTTSSGRNPIYDSYTYGYSFIHDGYPCAIIGIVMDESQPQAEKENVKKIVDEMIKTFRTER